jgi:thiamine kinase-like enzyme
MAKTSDASALATQQSADEVINLLATKPEWLSAVLERDKVLHVLTMHVPELASGVWRITECGDPRWSLKDGSGRWRGTYYMVIEGLPGEAVQEVSIRALLLAPGLKTPETNDSAQPFGMQGWRLYMPELRLACEVVPPEQALETLPLLTDPEQARLLLERAIRASAPAYRDIRIRACRPEILNYKPGSRCTLRYHLEYDQADANRGWPAAVIAKTYDDDKGEQAIVGMEALWQSPLARSDAVRIAEPLGYIPELKLLLQAPLHEEQILEDVIRAALRERTPEALARLHELVRATARGLAALHTSGAHAGEISSWDERIAEIPELSERLTVVDPRLPAAMAPLYDQLQALAAAHPADPMVPSHGGFDGDQVLIAQGELSFIDFDGFCMAEPALDVGHFRCAIMDSGMQVVDETTLRDPAKRQAYLEMLEQIGDVFLAEYQTLAPISRERLNLWEALDYLRDALHLWKKPKASNAERVLSILQYHLRRMKLLD